MPQDHDRQAVGRRKLHDGTMEDEWNLEIVQGQGNLFSKDHLQKDLVEGEVDDSRVEHRFGHELSDNSEDVGSFTRKICSIFDRARHRQTYRPLSLPLSSVDIGAGNSPSG